MGDWRTEWRRNGAGVMAATFLVGGGWVSASQTFVTSKNGQLVAPVALWMVALGVHSRLRPRLLCVAEHLCREVADARALRKASREESSKSWADMTRDMSERSGRSRTVQVELIDRNRPVPLGAPRFYQVAQLRQVLAKLREAEIFEFDFMTLDGGLKVVPRVGTDPSYEPLFVSPKSEALAELAASGELTIEANHHYRIHPTDPSSGADPNSGTQGRTHGCRRSARTGCGQITLHRTSFIWPTSDLDSQGVSELRLDHGEGRFDVRPLVVAGRNVSRW